MPRNSLGEEYGYGDEEEYAGPAGLQGNMDLMSRYFGVDKPTKPTAATVGIPDIAADPISEPSRFDESRAAGQRYADIGIEDGYFPPGSGDWSTSGTHPTAFDTRGEPHRSSQHAALSSERAGWDEDEERQGFPGRGGVTMTHPGEDELAGMDKILGLGDRLQGSMQGQDRHAKIQQDAEEEKYLKEAVLSILTERGARRRKNAMDFQDRAREQTDLNSFMPKPPKPEPGTM